MFVVIDDEEHAIEDTDLSFCCTKLRNTLGYHAPDDTSTQVDVGGESFVLSQRPEYMRSALAKGVTGAVLWQTSIDLLNYLLKTSFFEPHLAVLELGSGVGLAPCVLSRHVKTFIASDNDLALLKLLERNVERNHRRGDGTVEVLELDWQDPIPIHRQSLEKILETGGHDSLDLILCLDCVYSPHLADLLLSCLIGLLKLFPRAKILIGQQMREETLHADFVGALTRHFHVERLKMSEDYDVGEVDEGTRKLLEGISGYLLYIATKP